MGGGRPTQGGFLVPPAEATLLAAVWAVRIKGVRHDWAEAPPNSAAGVSRNALRHAPPRTRPNSRTSGVMPAGVQCCGRRCVKNSSPFWKRGAHPKLVCRLVEGLAARVWRQRRRDARSVTGLRKGGLRLPYANLLLLQGPVLSRIPERNRVPEAVRPP